MAHGIDPERVTARAVIGVVDRVEIVELNARSFEARRAEHLADASMERSGERSLRYGWQLANPRALPEEPGVHLGLLLRAVKPIAKMNRVEAIAHGIRALTGEEVYYWYSKCTTQATADRAQKALRMLLAEE